MAATAVVNACALEETLQRRTFKGLHVAAAEADTLGAHFMNL